VASCVAVWCLSGVWAPAACVGPSVRMGHRRVSPETALTRISGFCRGRLGDSSLCGRQADFRNLLSSMLTDDLFCSLHIQLGQLCRHILGIWPGSLCSNAPCLGVGAASTPYKISSSCNSFPEAALEVAPRVERDEAGDPSSCFARESERYLK
jgi:hypothetical protein